MKKALHAGIAHAKDSINTSIILLFADGELSNETVEGF